MRALVIVLSYTLFAVGSVSCGGGSAPAESPESRGEESVAAESASETEPAPEAPPRAAPRCTDGTCFECGDGICPAGYYCDESDEAVCSWLPACGATPSCSCLKGRLGAGCSCDAREVGLFVTCK